MKDFLYKLDNDVTLNHPTGKRTKSLLCKVVVDMCPTAELEYEMSGVEKPYESSIMIVMNGKHRWA